MGTLDYSAPEQIRGQRVDARTDEYALACVAFVLLSGQPPFHRNEAMAVMYAHLSVPPPALTSLRPGLPSEVDDIMQRALAKAPEDRYPSCGEFADALRIALGLRRYSSDPARARKLGPDHHDTLAARFNVAQQMAARGNHAAAEEEFRGLLTGLRRRLGPNHPDTLATWFSIAQQQAARGDDAGAEKEFRYMLPHLRSRLGADHPVTLIAWFSIAQQLAGRGDDAAEKDFRDMLPQLRSKLGPDHPNTLAAAEWIKYIEAKRSAPSPALRPRG
jgi:serine/threonine protein kinase